MLTRVWQEGEMEAIVSRVLSRRFASQKSSGDLFHNSMNIFDTTELYTLKMMKKLNFVLFITSN